MGEAGQRCDGSINVGPSLTGMEKFGLLDSLIDWMMPYSSSFRLRPSLNVYCFINFLCEDLRPG